jgi:hypothetical protein
MQANTHFLSNIALILRMKNVSDTSCRENQNTHSVFSNFLFSSLAFYEIMWKNNVKPDRPQTTIWSMRIAGWISKATNINSEYVIFILLLAEGSWVLIDLSGILHVL